MKKLFGGADEPPQASAQAAKTPSPNNSKAANSEKKPASTINIFIEVFVGLVVAYVCYLILGIIMRQDKVFLDKESEATARTKTIILPGLNSASNRKEWNTVVPGGKNFVDLRPSNNIKGGAQFSYSFWINIGTGISSDVEDKILFMKGVNKGYNFNVIDNTTGVTTRYRNDLLVYSPMVKFGKTAQSLEVCFNTLARHNEKLVIAQVETADNTLRNNVMSMIQGTWALITITFEDNIPINEFENGIVVKVYVQDQLYRVGRYQSALKQNYGDFYVFPNDKNAITNVQVSELTYYNYALSPKDVETIVYKGPNLSIGSSSGRGGTPQVLSDYNKLDIYN